MAINLGAAYIDIVPSTSGLAPALRREVDGPLGHAGDQGGRTFSSRFVGAVTGAGSRAASALGTAVTVGVGAAGLGAGGLFGASFATGFSRFTSLENAEKMLSQLGLSTDQVEGLMGSLNETLTGTAFAMDEGAGALSRMVSSGLGLDKVPGVLQSITDAAAFGQAPMSEIGDIFGRIQSQGRVTAMELNRLTARNIPAFELLASAMGLGVEELQGLVSAGDLDAATFFDAWEEGAKGFGENNIVMAGAAQSMGDTTEGALANMKAAIARFGVTAFAPIFEQIGPLANRIRDGLNQLAPIVAGVVQRVSAAVGSLVAVFQADGIRGVLSKLGKWIAEAAREWGGRLVEAWPAIRAGLARMAESVGAWIVATVPVIARQLVAWGKAFAEWIGPQIPPALRELGRLAGALGTWILDRGLPLLGEHLTKWGAAFLGWIGPQIPGILAELGKMIGELTEWAITDALPKLVSTMAEWGLAFWGWVAGAGVKLIERLNLWWWGSAFPWFADLPLKIIRAIGDLAGKFLDLGKDAGEALIRGIEDSLLGFKLPGTGASAGAWSRFWRGTFGNLPGLADGGPVTAGRPYIVGEQGPELFVPRRSGEIIPNYAMADLAAPAVGGGVTIENIDARGTDDPFAMADHLRRLLGWEMTNAGVA